MKNGVAKKLKAYVAVPIMGARTKEDEEIAKSIVDEVGRYAHVVNPRVADASVTSSGEDLSAADVFQRDYDELHKSDVLIIEASKPSNGVGMEQALFFDKSYIWPQLIGQRPDERDRILVLYNPRIRNRISKMVAGCLHTVVATYESDDELKKIIGEFFTRLYSV